MQPIAQKKELKLNVEIMESKLPLVFIDTLRFHEVMENLIANALEYTPARCVATVIINKNNKDVFISVKDTGIGMRPSDQKKLFTKFYRSEKAIAQNPEGSGLGLYVVRSYIVEWG